MSELIVPREIEEIMNRDPLKLKLMDTDKYVKDNSLQFVKSPSIFEVNSSKFHPLGLFSEEIFGSVTDLNRFTTEAAIELNTYIIHPVIFANVISKNALYKSILSGKQHAIFDNKTHDFIATIEENDKASTGFKFFIENISKLADTKEPDALRARNKHQLLVKYKNTLLTKYIICIPAGLRDLDLNAPRLSKDDINKIYLGVLNLTASLSDHNLSEDNIFDGIRYQIQLKAAEIYEYINTIISGKSGFLQQHYGARKVAFSTRNVISVAVLAGDTPDAPTNIKANETMIPILNFSKCFQPFVVNYIKNKVYGELFVNGGTERIAATNTKTLEIEYINVTMAEMNKYTTSDGVNRIVNQFKHVGFRESPVSIMSSDRKEYYLMLTYHTDEVVYIGKSVSDLENLAKADNIEFDIVNVKSIYWVELMYIIGLKIAKGKHVFITRYPVVGDGSIYPSGIHLITTNPSKEVKVKFGIGVELDAPHFPILGTSYYESAILHPSRLSGLNADMDGDMVSLTAVWSDESNLEIAEKSRSISHVIGSDFKLAMKANGDIVKLAIHNLSRMDITR
jgi:hypothetical protein